METVNMTLGLGPELVSLIAKALMVINFTTLLSIAGVAGITFGILDVFMGKKINMKYTSMGDDERAKFVNSLLLLASAILPITIIVMNLFKKRIDFMNILICAGIGLLLSFIFSLRMKSLLGISSKKAFMISEAIEVAIKTIVDNLAVWLQKFIIGLINLIIETIHAPFIMYYILIATIINIILSFAITGFMGVSQAAGTVNVIGSLVGGVVHGIVRRKKIAELRALLKGDTQ